MGRAAVEAAKAVGYRGAGTVEFVVDGSGPLRADGFWFMEMNTRLQVEHPVSEAITGLDLVELQLRVAAGEPLPFTQQDLEIDGWAFEARVYAEDVPKGFLPAIGTLDHLSFPDGARFRQAPVRIDSGVRQGDAISPWYDPMIAKVVVHGPTRAAALNLLTTALGDCHITGSVTNLEFLHALSRHPDFMSGAVDTGLISRDVDRLTDSDPPPEPIIAVAAVGGLGLLRARTETDPWDLLAGWRHWTEAKQYVVLSTGAVTFHRRVTVLGRGRYRVDDDGDGLEIEIASSGAEGYWITWDGVTTAMTLVDLPGRICVFADGRSHRFDLPDALAVADAEQAGGDAVIAPMPGQVTLVSTEAGAAVTKGDALVVLEAMKMEHTLTAPRDGVVAEILARAGDQVTDGTILLRLESDHG